MTATPGQYDHAPTTLTQAGDVFRPPLLDQDRAAQWLLDNQAEFEVLLDLAYEAARDSGHAGCPRAWRFLAGVAGMHRRLSELSSQGD